MPRMGVNAINQNRFFLGYALGFLTASIASIFSSEVSTLLFAILHHPALPFGILFMFRYLRLLVHLFSFWVLYNPSPIPDSLTYTAADVTVILPTVEPQNKDFLECILSTLSNKPKEIIIVTVGSALVAFTKLTIAPLIKAYPDTILTILSSALPNKRFQVSLALHRVSTSLVVLLDDHVFWPSSTFLPTLIAPFEDPNIGGVGTNKRVRRTNKGFNVRSFWNMTGAIYLERHNFEIRATNALDGGVFVISGRTAAYRSSILCDPALITEYVNEKFFFGNFGPLVEDDDNFSTRWLVEKGWGIKIQYCKEACIETTLGTYPKFLSQCLRWVRTTWRSNSASLFTDRTVWRAQPWCVYAVYITSFFNFALFYDAALWASCRLAFGTSSTTYGMIAWIFASKMVKLTPYFLREPQDLVFLPGYFAFAYFHSLVKLYAGLTFWVTGWGGRNLKEVGKETLGDVEVTPVAQVRQRGLSNKISGGGNRDLARICEYCDGRDECKACLTVVA